MKPVLLISNDNLVKRTLTTAIADRGGKLSIIEQFDSAINLLESSHDFKHLIFDLQISSKNHFKESEELQTNAPLAKILLLAKELSAKTCAKLLRNGASDFLTLPLDPEELLNALDDFLGRLGPSAPPKKNNRPYQQEIIGSSQALVDVFKMVDKVAKTDSTVLIYGESGTGKELIARAIHQGGLRKKMPLIPVNCGAIPEELLETELFGHEKGAFTNAIRTRIGRFEMANGGSIFLDEIGDMSPKLQVKILRVLQEQEFERVGGTKTIKVDLRIITATNVNLLKAVENGLFREDLYYRLNVIPIKMPPLRDRIDDIPILANYFLNELKTTRNSTVESISKEALDYLKRYNWPGNIRELENLMERMAILADDIIVQIHDLPAKIIKEVKQQKDQQKNHQPLETDPLTESELVNYWLKSLEDFDFNQGLDFNDLVNEFENYLIVKALEVSDGVKNKAAKLLKLKRTTLVEKMKKKGL